LTGSFVSVASCRLMKNMAKTCKRGPPFTLQVKAENGSRHISVSSPMDDAAIVFLVLHSDELDGSSINSPCY
jgi:hypothetical protein